MEEKKTIAIFGGSFDPPTISHVQIACELYNSFADVDEVWFVPCGDGRGDKSLRTDGLHRQKMLELILKDLIEETLPIKVNDIEIKNKKYFPTWNLLLTLQEQFINYKFLFCIGTDLIDSLHKWDNGDRLMKEVNFIVLQRPEYMAEKNNFPANFRMMNTISDGSSTKIRNRIQQQSETQNKLNLGINGLTTVSVINYIIKNSLYRKD